MKITLRMFVLAAALPALLTLAAAAGAPAQDKFVLQGGTLINGVLERPLKDNLVVVEGGRITGVGKKSRLIIPQDAEIIDVTGKYIMPGIIDVHVREESKADWPRYLAWGITSVNCIYENSDTALDREAWSQRDTTRAPRIFATAPVFTVKGGWWEGDGFPVDPTVDRFPETPGEARAAVRALNARGIRRIKLMFDDMGWCRDPLPRLKKMDPGVMNALLDEARKLKILAEVHSPMMADATAAVAGGAPVLVQGILDERVDAPLVEAILSGDGFYVPTFSLYRSIAGADTFMAQVFSDPRFRNSLPPETVAALTGPEYAARCRERYPNAQYVRSRLGVLDDNLSSLISNYAQVALGTDLWALPGIGAHLELESMVKAGMTPMRALTVATFLSAKAIRIFSKTGTIEPGKDADLLILDADPLADIRNTRSISMVIRMGKIYRPAELLGTAGR
jgi:imidazolonepropionase-like amidohydrolase